MKKLIINADDFGYTPGVSLGIIEAHNKGIVTSTTALAVSPHFMEAMEQARLLAPRLAIGVHLALTLRHFKPILPADKVPSLVNECGEFKTTKELIASGANFAEVEMEWEAQILRFLESGFTPTHFDSHHNSHYFAKELLDIALKLAKKYNVPLRNCEEPVQFPFARLKSFTGQSIPDVSLIDYYGTTPTTDFLFGNFYGEEVSFETIEKNFEEMVASDGEIFEMNCHPAFIDPLLTKVTSYLDYRTSELEILCDERLKNWLREKNILLTTFKAIQPK